MIKQANVIFKHAQINVEGNTIRCEDHTIQMTNISRIWTGKRHESELPLDIIVIILLVNLVVIHFFNTFFAVLTVLGSITILAWKHVIQGKDGLHLKLCSGDLYSFISDNKSFVNQVYLLLNDIMTKRNTGVHYNIIFYGNGEIKDILAASQEAEKARQEAEKEKMAVEEAKEETEEEAKEKIKEKMKEKMEEEMREEMREEMKEGTQVSYGPNNQLISQLKTLYTAYSGTENADAEIISLIGQTAHKLRTNDLTNMNELYRKFIESGLISECNDLGLNVLIGEIKNHIFG